MITFFNFNVQKARSTLILHFNIVHMYNHMYLSEFNLNLIKVMLLYMYGPYICMYFTLKLRQMAEMLKLYHIAIRFHPPWLRKHRHTSRPTVLKNTRTSGGASQTCAWKALAISLPQVGKRTSISTCGPTRFWDFWSHTHQRSHTLNPIPSTRPASSKRQILGMPFEWSTKFQSALALSRWRIRFYWYVEKNVNFLYSVSIAKL